MAGKAFDHGFSEKSVAEGDSKKRPEPKSAAPDKCPIIRETDIPELPSAVAGARTFFAATFRKKVFIEVNQAREHG